jgi:hypothetical protein
MLAQGVEPLILIPVNDAYVLAIYQGSLSQYDLLLKYRQMQPDGKWTRIRTPKHIHWAVDILIKMHENEAETKRFVDFLLHHWHNDVSPLRSDSDREALLNVDALLQDVDAEARSYVELSNKGVFSVKFLLLIAKLLMVQEKTNREDAYMFRKVLESLREGKDIFSIISTATHR